MTDNFYTISEKARLGKKFMDLKPDAAKSAMEFFKKAFEEGKLPKKTKELIAMACAHITQCPYCIDSHVKEAKKAGATDEEIAEAIYVAVAMAAGGAMAHARIAMQSLEE
jgi:AhpD family alkylhydroperoxidase